MSKFAKSLFTASIAASMMLSQVAGASPSEMIQQMDPNAPNYNAPACKEVRDAVLRPPGAGPVVTVYQSHRVAMPPGTAYAIGGLAIIMLIGAAHEEARREEIIADMLIDRCGEDAFIAYFQVKAQKGDDDAAAWLGTAYVHKQDWPQAAHWYQAGADRHNAVAEAGLGTLYAQGKGVPQDRAMAASWWQKAADHGSVDAERSLGQMYAEDQNYAKASEFYRTAAVHRDGAAAFALAQMYEQGQGVERSDTKAFAWYSMASLGLYPDADAHRSAVAARMKQDDIEDEAMSVQACFYSKRCRF